MFFFIFGLYLSFSIGLEKKTKKKGKIDKWVFFPRKSFLKIDLITL